MLRDDRVRYFDTVRVVIEGSGLPHPVTFAKLPDGMRGYGEMLAGHSDDDFIYWYCDSEQWEKLLAAKAGDELPSEDIFVRFEREV